MTNPFSNTEPLEKQRNTKDFSMNRFVRKIKRSEIDVHTSDEHYFLEIHSHPYFDIFRSFNTLPELLNHLKKYPIENKSKIISEIRRLDRLK